MINPHAEEAVEVQQSPLHEDTVVAVFLLSGKGFRQVVIDHVNTYFLGALM
jgi:hypothetical protein